jgi:hypothetical protein
VSRPGRTPSAPRASRSARAAPETDHAAPHPKPRHAWFTTVCAVVGLAVGAVGLFWDFAPQFRPDPLDAVGADVAVVAVEPGVSLGRWLREAHGENAARVAREVFGRTPSASELAQAGEMIYIRTQVDGHKHKDIQLRYRLHVAASGKPFEIPLPPELASVQRSRLDAPSQRSIQLLWMPALRGTGEGDVFLRVELRSDRGLLAVADSGTLRNGVLQP